MSYLYRIPLRAANFVIGVWWYWMERIADWLVSMVAKTEYIRQGKCKRCGRCCRLLALEVPRWAEHSPLIIRTLNWWHDTVLNFEFYGQDRTWLVYRCRYFRTPEENPDDSQNENARAGCSIYPFRHRLCRYYPHQRQFGHPKLHQDCGFSFIRRDDGKPSFDEVLRIKRRST